MTATVFQDVFDLTVHPEQIQPAYWFYGLFVGIGVAMLILGIILMRWRARWRKYTLIFSLIWLSFVSFMTVQDFRDASQIRSAVGRGEYDTIEGCLDYFHPGNATGSRTTAGNERWAVKGVEFDYGQGEVRRGYHLVEARGGAVHPTTRVRVSFVESDFYRRKEIVKLAVIQNACSSAPDRGYQ